MYEYFKSSDLDDLSSNQQNGLSNGVLIFQLKLMWFRAGAGS